MGFVKAAELEELWSGEKAAVVVDGTPVLIVNFEGTIRAYEDRCPHQGVPLSEGALQGRVLACRAHHWQFDACTGLGINPAQTWLRPFPVKVEDGWIFVNTEGKP